MSSPETEPAQIHPEQMEFEVNSSEMSLLGKTAKFFSDLGKVMLTADKGDIARGMGMHF
jgi:hypothetical protein